jgi:hypothetical protein
MLRVGFDSLLPVMTTSSPCRRRAAMAAIDFPLILLYLMGIKLRKGRKTQRKNQDIIL